MPADDAKRLDRARLLFRQGRWSMAADVLRDHLAAEPDDPIGHAMLATALLNVAPPRHALARDAANSAVRLDPLNPYCLYIRAIVAVHTDVRLPPGTPARDTPANGGIRLRQSRAIAEQALALDPDYLFAWQLLARIADDMEDYEAMRRYAGESLRIAPLDEDSLALHARALCRMKLWPEALAAAEHGLRLLPHEAPLHHIAGWAKLELGDRAGAIVRLRESLRLDPSNRTAQATYRRARGGWLSPAVAQRMTFAVIALLILGPALAQLLPRAANREAATVIASLLSIVGLAMAALAIRDWRQERASRRRYLGRAP